MNPITSIYPNSNRLNEKNPSDGISGFDLILSPENNREFDLIPATASHMKAYKLTESFAGKDVDLYKLSVATEKALELYELIPDQRHDADGIEVSENRVDELYRFMEFIEETVRELMYDPNERENLIRILSFHLRNALTYNYISVYPNGLRDQVQSITESAEAVGDGLSQFGKIFFELMSGNNLDQLGIILLKLNGDNLPQVGIGKILFDLYGDNLHQLGKVLIELNAGNVTISDLVTAIGSLLDMYTSGYIKYSNDLVLLFSFGVLLKSIPVDYITNEIRLLIRKIDPLLIQRGLMTSSGNQNIENPWVL